RDFHVTGVQTCALPISAISSLNPDIKLPSQPITLVYRSDSSGTTAGFTYYLAEVDPSFKDKIGAGKTVNWKSGLGGKGNAGVARSEERRVGKARSSRAA